MLTVYHGADTSKWNSLVRSFSSWDVYYLYEYAHSFMLHGDGKPLLISYEDSDVKLCYVVMKRDIADDPAFSGHLARNMYFDFESPYGYGGPLSECEVPETSQLLFLSELTEYCKKNRIVSQFIRFHPLLNNEALLPRIFESRYLRDTIFIDTSAREGILTNMDSKNRNMVRKAQKSGVTIVRRPIEDYGDFLSMYRETMERNCAEEYYTFSNEYFHSLEKLRDNACVFYAMVNDIPISSAIMLFTDRVMHYHLSGTRAEFRRYAPSNLLLYEAACWANSMGMKYFHLGGGRLPDDSLFGFKKQFSRNGRLPFYVGKTIFNLSEYNTLLQLRKSLDPDFDENNGYMIQYRR